MMNKWRHKASNTIRTGFKLRHLIAGFCLMLANSSNVVASSCSSILVDGSTADILRFINTPIDKFSDRLCKYIEDGDMDAKWAGRILDGSILRFAACRDNRINPDFKKYLKEEESMSDTVVMAHEHFCHNTVDPNVWDKIKHRELVKYVDWLRAETICNSMNEFFNPSGFIQNYFMPDLPSLKKFEKKTDVVCKELKNGDIAYKDAVYRLKLAYEEFKKRAGPEYLKKAEKDFMGLLKTLLD